MPDPGNWTDSPLTSTSFVDIALSGPDRAILSDGMSLIVNDVRVGINSAPGPTGELEIAGGFLRAKRGGGDPDGDLRPNLLEDAVGSDPNLPDKGPAIALGESPDGQRLTLTFNRIADPILTYLVEATSALEPDDWTPVWSSTGASYTAGPVTVEDTELMSGHARRFLRLMVTH